MTQKLKGAPVACDAPAYSVVRACRHAGFRAPEDVRWLRLPPREALAGLFGEFLRVLESLSGLKQPALACACGAALPPPGRYEFRRSKAKKHGYWFTQCKRCHTMHWDEAAV